MQQSPADVKPARLGPRLHRLKRGRDGQPQDVAAVPAISLEDSMNSDDLQCAKKSASYSTDRKETPDRHTSRKKRAQQGDRLASEGRHGKERGEYWDEEDEYADHIVNAARNGAAASSQEQPMGAGASCSETEQGAATSDISHASDAEDESIRETADADVQRQLRRQAQFDGLGKGAMPVVKALAEPLAKLKAKADAIRSRKQSAIATTTAANFTSIWEKVHRASGHPQSTKQTAPMTVPEPGLVDAPAAQQSADLAACEGEDGLVVVGEAQQPDSKEIDETEDVLSLSVRPDVSDAAMPDAGEASSEADAISNGSSDANDGGDEDTDDDDNGDDHKEHEDEPGGLQHSQSSEKRSAEVPECSAEALSNGPGQGPPVRNAVPEAFQRRCRKRLNSASPVATNDRNVVQDISETMEEGADMHNRLTGVSQILTSMRGPSKQQMRNAKQFCDVEAELSDEEAEGAAPTAGSDDETDDEPDDKDLEELIDNEAPYNASSEQLADLHRKWVADKEKEALRKVVQGVKNGFRKPGDDFGVSGDARLARLRRGLLDGDDIEVQAALQNIDLYLGTDGIADGHGSPVNDEGWLQDYKQRRPIADIQIQQQDVSTVSVACDESSKQVMELLQRSSCSMHALIAQTDGVGRQQSNNTMPPSKDARSASFLCRARASVKAGSHVTVAASNAGGNSRSYVFGRDESRGALQENTEANSHAPSSFAGLTSHLTAAKQLSGNYKKKTSTLLGLLESHSTPKTVLGVSNSAAVEQLGKHRKLGT